MILARARAWPAWWKRLGAVGALFFLVKGLLWLSLPALLALTECSG